MSIVDKLNGTTVRLASDGTSEEIRTELADGDRDVHAVGSTGIARIEPLVLVTREDQTGFFPACSVDDAAAVASALDDGFETAVEDAAAVVEHDPGTGQLPAADLDGLSVGNRAVLGPCGWLRPTEPDDYGTALGFDLPDRSAIEAAGAAVQGRGWGDWCRDETLSPTWTTAREAAGETTVVVNAHGPTAEALPDLIEEIGAEIESELAVTV